MTQKETKLNLRRRVWLDTNGTDFLIGMKIYVSAVLEDQSGFIPREIASGTASARVDETTTVLEVMSEEDFITKTDIGKAAWIQALRKLYERMGQVEATIGDQVAMVKEAQEKAEQQDQQEKAEQQEQVAG